MTADEILMEPVGSGTTINLSLISHTNAGKTTLARTLLGRDVGEVRDAAHVTEVASGHVVVQAGEDTLMLWDTPGFGDTARLLKRLRVSGNPIGWLLSEVWDRWRERPLWSSQQAVKNARDHADVILYLINASEDPAAAAYVDLEMEVLAWIGKPVILLLNQMGPPREGIDKEVEAWRAHLSGWEAVAGALPLDAFARCWVQEGALLAAVEPLLPPDKAPAMTRLSQRWMELVHGRFEQSMAALAKPLAEAARDKEAVGGKGWRDQMAQLLSAAKGESPEMRAAMERLSGRLAAGTLQSTEALTALHGLSGKATRTVLERVGDDFARSEQANEGFAAAIGGVMTGAVTGLAADVMAGGLTLGGGMIVGAILGAVGAGGLARGFNLVRGEDGSSVRWSEEFFAGIVNAAILRYLAVAHFGRGRGDWEEAEHPAFWVEVVEKAVGERREDLKRIYEGLRAGDDPAHDAALEALLAERTALVLARLYPTAASAKALAEKHDFEPVAVEEQGDSTGPYVSSWMPPL
ncbi:MAG: DUF3482 domain-containing protein [Sphingomonadaceae bacterium]